MSGQPEHAKPQKPRVQYAALPYREQAEMEVLLVTSRERGRWVLPKGWPMKRKAPHQAAAVEALEEAGVTGKISKDRIGRYSYEKRLANGDSVECTVEVYPLRVKVERDRWPERQERQRHWFSLSAAAELVEEPELKALLTRFGAAAAAA